MRIEGVLFWVFPHRGECEFREKNILGKSCTTFVIVKIVRNLSRGRSPCQRVNHVKSGVIYFSAIYFFAFIYSRIRYYSYVEPGPNTNISSLLVKPFIFYVSFNFPAWMLKAAKVCYCIEHIELFKLCVCVCVFFFGYV